MHPFIPFIVLSATATSFPALDDPIKLDSRRELFVDRFLIGQMKDVRIELNRPRDEGVVLKFDNPWEGAFCGYCTVIHDDKKFRCYYRGLPASGKDGSSSEVTCYAESADGQKWTKPMLGLFEVDGTKQNNVVLTGVAPVTHNFSPFLDTRPGVPVGERWKGLGGTMTSGLVARLRPTVCAGGGSATSR